MPIAGLYFPWETARGEGFIAPWSKAVETPAGLQSVAAANPGEQLLTNLFGAPDTPLPAGPSASVQEVAQAVRTGQNGQAGVTELESSLNIPGVNTGGAVIISPGDSLDGVVSTVAPVALPALGVGGTLGGLLGGALGLGALGTGLLAGAGALVSRFKFPWQTPAGEGFIAPWTEQQQLPGGLWGQEEVAYPSVNGAQAAAPGLAGLTYAQLKGGLPVKAWTNASKDGRFPATVAFVKFSNGMMASQSLVDGTIETWKPKKHIVISNNPRLSSVRKLYRVKARVDKMVSKAIKVK